MRLVLDSAYTQMNRFSSQTLRQVFDQIKMQSKNLGCMSLSIHNAYINQAQWHDLQKNI